MRKSAEPLEARRPAASGDGQAGIEAALRAGFAGAERGVEAEQRRAVRTDLFAVAAHVQEHMRMIEGRAGADAHEFLDANIDRRMTGIVLEMWYGVPGHRRLPQAPDPIAARALD